MNKPTSKPLPLRFATPTSSLYQYGVKPSVKPLPLRFAVSK